MNGTKNKEPVAQSRHELTIFPGTPPPPKKSEARNRIPVCQKADFRGPEELRQRPTENQKKKEKKKKEHLQLIFY